MSQFLIHTLSSYLRFHWARKIKQERFPCVGDKSSNRGIDASTMKKVIFQSNFAVLRIHKIFRVTNLDYLADGHTPAS